MKEYLFVYGLLRQKAKHEKSSYLAENAKFIADCTYQGKLYLIDYYPGVIPSENADDQVIGEVFEVTKRETLEELDYFEGIGDEFPQPNEYVRQLEEITLLDGIKMKAWVYVFNKPVNDYQEIESGDFLTYYN